MLKYRFTFQHIFTHSFACMGAIVTLLLSGAQSASRGDARPHHFDRDTQNAKSSFADAQDNYRASLSSLLHWAHFPVRVAFVNDMTGGGQELDRLARNGFDQWVSATRGGIKYETVSDAAHADVTVTYDVIGTRPGNGERLGQTGFKYNRARSLLSHADIHLNVWEHMTRGDLARFQNTAAHEFGHALGINGHSPNPDDLMYFSSSASDGVTAHDLNTLRQAYGGFSRAFASAGSSATKRL